MVKQQKGIFEMNKPQETKQKDDNEKIFNWIFRSYLFPYIAGNLKDRN